MARSNSDSMAAAVAATDAELFQSSLNGEDAVYDDTGDRSLEQQDDGLEGAVEDLSEEEVEVEAKPEGEAETETAERKRDEDGKFVKKDEEAEPAPTTTEQAGRVPPARLREESEKRRAVEAERDALKAAREEDKREREALKAQMDLLSRQVTQRQQPEPKAPAVTTDPEPDMFAQPDEWRAWNLRDRSRAIEAVREDNARALVNMNLEATREVHGEKFDAAYKGIVTAAQNDPEARIAINRALASPNPGRSIMRWHQNQETLREFGSDPQAHIQKKIDEALEAKFNDPEFRKATFDKWRSDAGSGNGNGSPRHITRVPTTLKSANTASGSSHLSDSNADGDDTEEGLFRNALRTG